MGKSPRAQASRVAVSSKKTLVKPCFKPALYSVDVPPYSTLRIFLNTKPETLNAKPETLKCTLFAPSETGRLKRGPQKTKNDILNPEPFTP